MNVALLPPQAWAALFVLGTWWLSTAVVLRAVWLDRSALRATVGVAGGLGVLAGVALVMTRGLDATWAAYAAFVAAVVLWGFHEVTFLLGVVTGPRKIACPPDARGLDRFVYATAAILHHEVALVVTLAATFALTWEAPNQVAPHTFLVLWVMRLSAKLNVFLGVRNLTEEFVPEHLRYLATYFRRARLNALLPCSILVGGTVTAILLRDALSTNVGEVDQVGRSLVAALLGLAVVEHIFLAVPLREARLWRWIIRRAASGEAARPMLHERSVP